MSVIKYVIKFRYTLINARGKEVWKSSFCIIQMVNALGYVSAWCYSTSAKFFHLVPANILASWTLKFSLILNF